MTTFLVTYKNGVGDSIVATRWELTSDMNWFDFIEADPTGGLRTVFRVCAHDVLSIKREAPED